MSINEALILLLGWLLGLISPSIINKIEEENKAKKIRKSILSEIDEFRIIMAALVYSIESKYIAIDHELVDYLLPIYKKYAGVKQYKNTLTVLEKFENLDNEELKLLNQTEQSNKTHESLSLKKYYLPYLQAKVHELGLLDDDFQRKTLELLSLLNLFNDNVEESKFYYRLSFDGNISDINHQIAAQSLEELYIFIARQARTILEKIDTLDK